MTIKQNGGVFGRNPTYNDIAAESVTAGQLNSLGAVVALGAGVFGDDVDVTGDIDSSGSVTLSGSLGIGTSSPSEKMEIYGDTPNLLINNTSETASGIMFQDAQAAGTQNAAIKYNSSSQQLGFSVDNAERISIDRYGSTYFGATKTLYNDTTGEQGVIIGGTGTVQISRNNATSILLNRQGSDGTILGFYREGVGRGGISVTTSATAYNTTSDYRLKENITPIQGAANIVMAMQPCTYTAKSDGLWYDGFLAHELQEVHPRAVLGEKDAIDEEGNPEYQTVDYSKLTPILTAALQEALKKIDDLEARLRVLEAG